MGNKQGLALFTLAAMLTAAVPAGAAQHTAGEGQGYGPETKNQSIMLGPEENEIVL